MRYEDDASRRDALVPVPYDPEWALRFAEAADPLDEALVGLAVAPVEHIGSTAVPGLVAKPVVDMVAVLVDPTGLLADEGRLRALGWVPSHPDDAVVPRRLGYCRPDAARRTHHLHVVAETDPAWREWVAFRDRLRTDPELREAYARLKERLAADPTSTRESYRAAKAPFIRAAGD